MTDAAYDIAYLLEPELASSTPVNRRIVKMAARPACTPVKPNPEDVLARELMQSATVHDAFVQQYLGMAGSV